MKATVYCITPGGNKFAVTTVAHNFQHGLARSAWQAAVAHVKRFPRDTMTTGGISVKKPS